MKSKVSAALVGAAAFLGAVGIAQADSLASLDWSTLSVTSGVTLIQSDQNVLAGTLPRVADFTVNWTTPLMVTAGGVSATADAVISENPNSGQMIVNAQGSAPVGAVGAVSRDGSILLRAGQTVTISIADMLVNDGLGSGAFAGFLLGTDPVSIAIDRLNTNGTHSGLLTLTATNNTTLTENIEVNFQVGINNAAASVPGPVAVPGPVVGAGLPGLAVAFAGLLGYARRRRNSPQQ
jgi:hypothetical protein